jgi:Asp-tRNA(Asn)/Glu-tRNA(Gln) amidotransferase A subunit family amidase
MHLETHSFLGATVNPFNTALTSGGSSGGEGALIGMRGSVLGSVYTQTYRTPKLTR